MDRINILKLEIYNHCYIFALSLIIIVTHKISKIETVKSYSLTLEKIPQGETRVYKIKGADLINFQVAKSRMNKQGRDYSLLYDDDYVTITRHKDKKVTNKPKYEINS